MNAIYDDQISLPARKDSEDAILGMLCAGVAEYQPGISTAIAFDLLQPSDFYFPNHREIFASARNLHKRGVLPSFDTIQPELKSRNIAIAFEYLFELSNCYASTANGPWHLEQIRTASRARKTIELANKLQHDAQDTDNFDTTLARARESLSTICGGEQTPADTSTSSVGDIAARVLDELVHRCNYPNHLAGIPSGLQDLDSKTYGFQPGDLVIIGARPGMGKTTLGLSMAYLVANNYPLRVTFFSLEMSKERLVERMLAGAANVFSSKIRAGELDSWNWKHLRDAQKRMQDLAVDIVDCTIGEFTVQSLKAHVLRLRKEGKPPSLLIVDHMHIMKAIDKGIKDLREQMSEITRGLKQAAMELGLPLIVLAQLSRANEQRGNKKPIMSDLRESGTAEQDADTIVFIHRKEYYDKSAEKGTAELIIAKQRNGPICDIDVAYCEQTQTFRNITVKPWMPIMPKRETAPAPEVIPVSTEPVWSEEYCRTVIEKKGMLDPERSETAWKDAAEWAAKSPWALECFEKLSTTYDTMRAEMDELELFGF